MRARLRLGVLPIVLVAACSSHAPDEGPAGPVAGPSGDLAATLPGTDMASNASPDAGTAPVHATVGPIGVWTNVTPSNVNVTGTLPCGNYGVSTVSFDPMRPSDAYASFNCQGI